MLSTLSFFSGDKPLAISLANWIRDLGGVKNHECLLVVDKGTDAVGVIEPMTEAFGKVHVVRSDPVISAGQWGDGTADASAPNEMWLTAANYVFHVLKVPFFWMEADAAPTRSTWLDEIAAEYQVALSLKKRFMGMLVNLPGIEQHMSGIGVYPFDVANHSLEMMTPGKVAWDYAGRRDTVERQKAHFTDLIQHVYRKDGENPTFPTLESLEHINPRTAVYHRCKDFSLVDRLRERMASSGAFKAEMEMREKVADEPSNLLAKALAKIEELEEENSRLKSEVVANRISPQKKIGKTVNKKRTLSPEHLAKLADGRDKARARKLTGTK